MDFQGQVSLVIGGAGDIGLAIVRELLQAGANRRLLLRSNDSRHTSLTYIVVNGAGVFHDLHWEREIDINLKGVIRGSLLAWKHLDKDEGGRGGAVLNIASVLGIDPLLVTPIYCATKHGVVGFSRSLGHRGTHREASQQNALQAQEHEGRTGGRMLRPDWQPRGSAVIVPPAVVARSALRVLREGTSGSVWVSEGERTYRVHFRSRHQLAEDSH